MRAHLVWAGAATLLGVVLVAGARAGTIAPTDYEQYELELINRARANPTAEATRYGINLNEGLDAGTISTTAKQPLAFNLNLNASSRTHSSDMLASGIFSHIGADGTDPGTRDQQAGYVFRGSWGWAENIAWLGLVTDPTQAATQFERTLFTDFQVDGRSHRVNLMDPSYREAGIGIVGGALNGVNGTIATEDFAVSGTTTFLTGVAYRDLAQTGFYAPIGEGIGGVTVSAHSLTGATFTTTTFSSGGYSLALPDGNYTVTFSSPSLLPQNFSSVVVNGANVKLDLVHVDGAHAFSNPVNALDVNGDGIITSLDALQVINALNRSGPHALSAPAAGASPPPFIDVNASDSLSSLDALIVINALNASHLTSSLANSQVFVESLRGHSAPVPEPSSGILLLLGGAFAAAVWRLRRSR